MFRAIKQVFVATRESIRLRQWVRPRSRQWGKIKKTHLLKEQSCQWCGGVIRIEVHHIYPFHLFPEKELEESNLITLCCGCHFERGHNRDWREYNRDIRHECECHGEAVRQDFISSGKI